MKKILFLISYLFTSFTLIGQNEIKFNYQTVVLDSSFSKNEDVKMKTYIEHLHQGLAKKMNEVIAEAPVEMRSFSPQSPLSNYLTDVLVEITNSFCTAHNELPIDLSLLNFGGIRSYIPQGNVTVETLFNIFPFDNKIVIISLKGSELKKIFNRFTYKDNEPYSQVTIEYDNGIPRRIDVDHNKIEDHKIYRLATIDFIQMGGDKILSNIAFENVTPTDWLLRDAFIQYIKKMNEKTKQASGKSYQITAPLSNRVIIKPQP
ncbi:MAG: 5'-nucleotidase C-terminal domain-containing protein [Bacteroidales bacterium]